MDERILVLCYLDAPPEDEVAPGWLEHQLARARLQITELTTHGERVDIAGVWGGMPCLAHHLLDDPDGAVFLTFDPVDVAAAMALPPEEPGDLPPPLEAFANLCRGVGPKSALMTADVVDEETARRWAGEITAAFEDSRVPDVFRTGDWAAYFVSQFALMMLEEDLAPPEYLDRIELESGDLFLRSAF